MYYYFFKIIFHILKDGASTLSFLPFVGENFKKEYIIPYYIGESLFALIPSSIALFQGVGSSEGCRNVTKNNETKLEEMPRDPNFDVEVYYLIIFGLMCVSIAAFVYLDCSKMVRKERQQLLKAKQTMEVEELNHQHHHQQQQNRLLSDQQMEMIQDDDDEQEEEEVEVDAMMSETKEEIILYTITFFTTFFFYGILAGVQTYSTLPYGNRVYHLAINLSNLFLPVAIFLSIWSYSVSIGRICVEFALAMLFTGYIVLIACFSPTPPLMDHPIGSILIVASWILSQCMFMRVRCVIAARLERFGGSTLTLVGFFNLFGEVVGGIVIFIIVEWLRFFTEKEACGDESSLFTNTNTTSTYTKSI